VLFRFAKLLDQVDLHRSIGQAGVVDKTVARVEVDVGEFALDGSISECGLLAEDFLNLLMLIAGQVVARGDGTLVVSLIILLRCPLIGRRTGRGPAGAVGAHRQHDG